MTRVKICGITNMGDAMAAVECGADALGFVFADSPRRITPEDAAQIAAALPPLVAVVAVTVDEPIAALRDKLATARCHAVQLHGDEPPEYAAELLAANRRWWVVKAFRVGAAEDLAALSRCAYADAVLLDSRVPDRTGGSGTAFDWKLARAAATSDELEIGGQRLRVNPHAKPIILAGGLKPDNVTAALEAVRPYAVDVSTGVEASPGRKDHQAMRAFVRAVREFDVRQA